MDHSTASSPDNGSALHRPLTASRLRDITTSELREHRDVRDVQLRRSVFSDRLGLDVLDFAGRSWRIDFVTAPAVPVWSRP